MKYLVPISWALQNLQFLAALVVVAILIVWGISPNIPVATLAVLSIARYTVDHLVVNWMERNDPNDGEDDE